MAKKQASYSKTRVLLEGVSIDLNPDAAASAFLTEIKTNRKEALGEIKRLSKTDKFAALILTNYEMANFTVHAVRYNDKLEKMKTEKNAYIMLDELMSETRNKQHIRKTEQFISAAFGAETLASKEKTALGVAIAAVASAGEFDAIENLMIFSANNPLAFYALKHIADNAGNRMTAYTKRLDSMADGEKALKWVKTFSDRLVKGLTRPDILPRAEKITNASALRR